MNKISSRQLFFLLACMMPVGKLVLMPNRIAELSKNDLLFPAAANYLLQAGVICLIMLLARKNCSLYDLLVYNFGKIAAKVITFLFSLFLFYAALLPLLEQKLFVQTIFYDTLPSFIAFSPYFLFAAYLCAKPLTSMGRVWDLLAAVAIVGFIGIMVFSLSAADYGALAPVGAAGGKGFLRGTGYTMNWFFESAIMLALLGKFEYKKGMVWKAPLFYLVGAAAYLLFLATFYGVYADVAQRQFFAFAKISRYFSGITVLGRIDYLFIFSLALVMAFFCTLPIHAGIDCLSHVFGYQKMKVSAYSVIVNLLFLALAVFLEYQFGKINGFISHTAFWIFPVFTVAFPLLALLLRRPPREEI